MGNCERRRKFVKKKLSQGQAGKRNQINVGGKRKKREERRDKVERIEDSIEGENIS